VPRPRPRGSPRLISSTWRWRNDSHKPGTRTPAPELPGALPNSSIGTAGFHLPPGVSRHPRLFRPAADGLRDFHFHAAKHPLDVRFERRISALSFTRSLASSAAA
jgi:hypothetical protein